MSQEDPYADYTKPMGVFARRHFAITPDNDEDLPILPLGIYCEGEGTAALVDEAGTELSYTLVQGQELPFRFVRVKATGTTATLYGWY